MTSSIYYSTKDCNNTKKFNKAIRDLSKLNEIRFKNKISLKKYMINKKQMELKNYSAETKDNFWISIGYHICKLRVDLDRIYTNIGEYNFYQTDRMRKLFFYYI
jgi:hypothetical protein